MGLSVYPASDPFPPPDTGWRDLWIDGAIEASNFTMTDGQVRVIGERCTVYTVLRNGLLRLATTATGTSAGAINDISVFTMPSDYFPAFEFAFTASSSSQTWGCRINTSGLVQIKDGYPGAALRANESLTISIDYILAGA